MINKLEFGLRINKLMEMAKKIKKRFAIIRGSILWYGWYEHNKCIKNNSDSNVEPSTMEVKNSSIFIQISS